MRVYQTPTQNIVYADVSGDIGFFSPGLVPLRKSGDGLAPVDGASGAFDWVGVIPFEQLPQLHNPEIGFAFNANNANVEDDHEPTFGQDWEEPFRARRIQQFFDTIDKHSIETSAAMQADRLSLAAKQMQPFIAMIEPSNERARQARAMLGGWNSVMDKDRPEPLIFTAFLGSLHRILLEEKTGAEAGGQRALCRNDPHFPHAQPSFVVRRPRQAGPGLQQSARAGARRGACAARQA